jgi:hypothetical protein
MFNATFDNIAAISWRLVLVVHERDQKIGKLKIFNELI